MSRQRTLIPALRAVKERPQLALAKAYSLLPYDMDETIVITGSPRSGTTWLAEMMATIRGSSILFEPCHLTYAPASERAGMTWRTMLEPGDREPSIEAYMRGVLGGHALTWWTGRLITRYGRTRTWIVKFVRANRMLPWLTTTFDLRRVVMIVRHPCAVVSSQLEWGFDAGDLPPEGAFVARHPSFAQVYERLATPEERLAFVWAADAYVPLVSTQRHAYDVVLYERLARDPIGEMSRILAGWGIEAPDGLAARTRRASDSVSERRASSDLNWSDMTTWRNRITPEQADRILAVAAAFGLDFYTDAPQPDLDHPLLRETTGSR